MYDDALHGWNTFDFQASTRNGMATERLYMNYPAPVVLQDYRYLGKDYRERERIKKKTNTILRKIDSMNEIHRTAILSAVIGKYKDAAAIVNE
jgi:hypothetical protein